MGTCFVKENNPKVFLENSPYKNIQLLEGVEEIENKHEDFRELHFKCRNLCKNEVDPLPTTFLILYEEKNNAWEVIEKTEAVSDDSNPEFAQCIKVQIVPQTIQKMKIEVRVIDILLSTENQSKELCSVEFKLSDFEGKEKEFISYNLVPAERTDGGKVLIYCDNLINNETKGNTMTIWAKIDPCLIKTAEIYYKIYRLIQAHAIEKESNDKQADNLLLANYSFYGKFDDKEQIYSWNDIKTNTNVLSLQENGNIIAFEIGLKEKNKRQRILLENAELSKLSEVGINCPVSYNGLEYGTFYMNCSVTTAQHSFIDYVQGGITPKLMIGIDFTRTNANGKKMHTSDLEENPYAIIIRALGSALLRFDQQQRVIGLGLGANIQDIGRSYCFALNGNIFEPEIIGLDHLLESYIRALNVVKLSGPTYFAEVLNYSADVVESYTKIAFNENPRYFVLLLIVDGSPLDIEETKEVIVKCSTLPMSIIIVGVNSSLCQSIYELLVQGLTARSGRVIKRDIIQFIDYQSELINMEKMIKVSFSKIQKQMDEYMSSHKIAPKKKANLDSRMSSPISEPSSAPADLAGSFFTEIQNKFRKELPEDKEPDYSELPSANKDRPTERRITISEKTEENENYDGYERLMAKGFPTRDRFQFKQAAKEKFFKNPLSPPQI